MPRPHARLVVPLLTALSLGSCGDAPPAAPIAAPSPVGTSGAGGPPWFEEISAAAGVRFTHQSGHKPGRYLFPEMSGSGTAIFDYDGDGRMDVLCLQSGPLAEEDMKELTTAGKPRPLSRLFRNLGGLKFEDVTERAGLTTAGYAMGASAADWDADGDADLLLLCVGDEIVYRNEGNGTFKDVTAESGLTNPTWSSHASFADFDGDGDLDVFVSNYINWARHREIACKGGDNNPDYCGPNNYKAPAIDSVYRNEGGGKFRDVSREAGLEAAYGNGFGVITADFDRDGRIDAYVANDGNENQLWINKGGFVFENKALTMGCALGPEGVAQAGMGVFTTDVNEDGFWDIFVTNLRDETNSFYVYDGKRSWFDDRVVQLGLGAPSRPFTGFGCGFADFDNDGRTDLYVANGSVMRPRGDPPAKDQPYGELNQLFRGVDGPKFVEVTPRGGTAAPLIHGSRGAAFGDLDDDGGIDAVVMNSDAPVYVLRNVAAGRGSFVGFRLVDEKGVLAIGAEAKATFGGKARRLLLQPGQSFCSSNDPRLHVGLGGAAQADALEVRWPGGKTETFGPFKAGAYYEVRRGSGR
jgi:hypothetical protein